MTATIDLHLLTAFLELCLVFGIVGWSVDIWIKTKLVFLYPLYGLAAFGSVVIPITYLVGKFNLGVMVASCLVLVGLGVFGAIRYGVPHRLRILWQPRSLFLAFVVLILVVLGLIQASKYAIPGGIDSAVHSSIIQGILVQQQGLAGAYPLGMHLTVLFFERLLHIQQEIVFLSFYLLLYISSIAGIAVIADRMLKRSMAGYIAVAIGCIDVSTFNNFLNGSGSHLVGVGVSVLLLLAAVVLEKKPWWYRYIGLSAAFTAIWYFHYPSLFFALMTLWGWRIVARRQPSWLYVAALGTSFVINLPMQLRLFHDASYHSSIIPGLLGVSLVEIILVFAANRLVPIIRHRISLTVLAIVSGWLFYHYSAIFLFLPTWYGVVIITLGVVGLLAAVVRRNAFDIMSLVSFTGLTALYSILNLPQIPGLSKVMIELCYYYGFTVSLILLAIAGTSFIVERVSGRIFRSTLLSISAIYIILVVGSRAFDQPLVGTILRDDRPISRYESSGGFGVFYTKNDAALAAWVKDHIPNDGIVANPGGLYNSWAQLTEHEVLFATYNVPIVGNAPDMYTSLTRLLEGESGVNLQTLLDHRVKYILLPENFSISIYHPRVILRKMIGQARFYEILPAPTYGSWLPIRLGATTTESGLTISTTGHYECRYCGNVFYFSDQSILKELILEPENQVTIEVPVQLHARRIDFFVDRLPSDIDIRVNGGVWKKVSVENVTSSLEFPAGKKFILELRNSSHEGIHIHALALRIS